MLLLLPAKIKLLLAMLTNRYLEKKHLNSWAAIEEIGYFVQTMKPHLEQKLQVDSPNG